MPKKHRHWHDYKERKNGSILLKPCRCGMTAIETMRQVGWKAE